MDGELNPDAVYVRGLCLYYQDNIDKAFQHFQQVLKLAPDHTKAKTVYKVSWLLSLCVCVCVCVATISWLSSQYDSILSIQMVCAKQLPVLLLKIYTVMYKGINHICIIILSGNQPHVCWLRVQWITYIKNHVPMG